MDGSDAEDCGEDGTFVVHAYSDAVSVETNPVAVSSACDVQKCV